MFKEKSVSGRPAGELETEDEKLDRRSGQDAAETEDEEDQERRSTLEKFGDRASRLGASHLRAPHPATEANAAGPRLTDGLQASENFLNGDVGESRPGALSLFGAEKE
ncbi:hypothetical protein G7046_g357 [Stylonectria norvegica]|nr:hypothetical protein G7046_g357 [Stylonectria norvegica]